MPNISRSRVALTTSNYRDIHEGDGLKPAEKRRIGLLEDECAGLKSRISDSQQQLSSVHADVTELQSQLSPIFQQFNALSTSHNDTTRDVAGLQRNLGVLATQQLENVSSEQLQCELGKIKTMIFEAESTLESLNSRVITNESEAASLHEYRALNETRAESMCKRLKVSEDKYKSIEIYIGLDDSSGPSLSQRLDSQSSTIMAVANHNSGTLSSLNTLTRRFNGANNNIRKLLGHVDTLFDQYRVVASHAGQVPGLQSRVGWLEQQLKALQQSVTTQSQTTGAPLDDLRTRINFIEGFEQNLQQVIESTAKIQADVSNLESGSNDMVKELHAVQDSMNDQAVRSDRIEVFVQIVEEDVEHLRHNFNDIEKQRLASEEEREQRHFSEIEQMKEEFASYKTFQEKRFEVFEEKIRSLEDSACADHAASTERFSTIENNLKQTNVARSQVITYAQGPTTDQPVVFLNGYVRWLRGLDFRLNDGMKGFKDRQVRVPDHMLFSDESHAYFLKRADRFCYEPKRAERDQCGLSDDDAYAAQELEYFEWTYRYSGFEAVHPLLLDDALSGRTPKYMVWLGEIYVRHRLVTSTGFHLFMDFTTPRKSLWMVFSRESSNGTSNTFDYQWEWFRQLLNKPFDLAMVAESIHDWSSTGASNFDEPQLDMEKVKICMEMSAAVAGTIFTRPNLSGLFGKLKDGWQ